MVKLNDAFPSEYLKADDLRGQTVEVTIANAAIGKIGDDSRLIITFQGKDKKLVANKTNANKIGDVYGDDTDFWIGKPVELYPSETDYQGKTVPCIRVRIPQSAQTAAAIASEAQAPLEDEVPF